MHLSNRLILAAAVIAVSLAGEAKAQVVGTAGTSDPRKVIWSDPTPIASRDLFWGAGSADRVPKGPFTFVENNSSGTQPKLVVTDSQGVTWDVKFGPEVKAEVASNRIVHALGFFTEEVYFVPSGQIDGVKDLQDFGGHVTGLGRFSNARFRRRDDNVTPLKEEWTFHDNPFKGDRELSGLQILMTMLANWDIRGAANNEVMRVTRDGQQEIRYLVGDLGATFGRMGGRLSARSKWNLRDYLGEGFIEKVEGDVVHLDYDGFDAGMDRVPLDHARWFAGVVSHLTHEQVRRAFEAAGATPEEVEGFSEKFMKKIHELQAAVK